MDNGIDSAVDSLENVFVHIQTRFNSLSLCSTPFTFDPKKLRADKRKSRVRKTVRDQTGGSKGVLIKLI